MHVLKVYSIQVAERRISRIECYSTKPNLKYLAVERLNAAFVGAAADGWLKLSAWTIQHPLAFLVVEETAVLAERISVHCDYCWLYLDFLPKESFGILFADLFGKFYLRCPRKSTHKECCYCCPWLYFCQVSSTRQGFLYRKGYKMRLTFVQKQKLTRLRREDATIKPICTSLGVKLIH